MDVFQDRTLVRLSAIAVSKQLLLQPTLRTALKEWVSDTHPKTAARFLPTIQKTTDDLTLPPEVKEELNYVLGRMCIEIRKWLYLIRQIYRFQPNEAELFRNSRLHEQIHWTPSGRVDIASLLTTWYWAGELPVSNFIWRTICQYFLEDCIEDMSSKVNFAEQFTAAGSICTPSASFVRTIIWYWELRLRKRPRKNIDKEKMMLGSLAQHHLCAVKHFWGEMKEHEKIQTVMSLSRRMLSGLPDLEFDLHRLEKTPFRGELLQFFLEILGTHTAPLLKRKMLRSGIVVRELLEWPYENLFLKVVEEVCAQYDFVDFGPIIERIFSNLNDGEHDGLKQRRIFQKLWRMNPPNFKNCVAYGDCLKRLWDSEDIEVLKCILEDEELSDRRQEYLGIMLNYHDDANIDSSFMVRFLTEVLVTDDEQRRLFSETADAPGKVGRIE